MKKILTITLMFLALLIHAEIKICGSCGKRGKRMPFTAQSSFFCSRKCLSVKISCSNCGRLPKGQYIVATAVDGTQHPYCQSCGSKTRCLTCALPTEKGKFFEGGDVQCFSCSQKVLPHSQVQRLFRELRNELAQKYGYDAKHPITLRLVSKKALEKVSGNSQALGCMRVNVTEKVYTKKRKRRKVVKWQCTLYLLNCMPPVTAAKVLVHELTHDYLNHHAGRGSDPRITEGICDAMSAAWLLSHNFPGYVDAMQKNPDPIYGAGFRLIFPQLQRYGLQGVVQRNRSNFNAF